MNGLTVKLEISSRPCERKEELLKKATTELEGLRSFASFEGDKAVVKFKVSEEYQAEIHKEVALSGRVLGSSQDLFPPNMIFFQKESRLLSSLPMKLSLKHLLLQPLTLKCLTILLLNLST
ncbi:hypothetical protein CFOL_v3_00706 [Cephalotus follicularis]|uniref:Uncharacterized protein n=1 Tax=Cephalotus follicularis TaxID=3775 RepID=A0A1Q3AN56_CEPFO|nr:hypothetical protein CFOL_v3_00706 [Cephalotus follicularis]